MSTMLRVSTMLVALIVTTVGGVSRAQPMIDQVPGDALLYAGWRGADDMGPDYAGSHLQGIVELTGIVDALPQLMDAMKAFAQEEVGPQEMELISAGSLMWERAWVGGGALYILPPEEDGAPPRMSILWTGAANDAELRDAVSLLVGMMNDQQIFPAFMGDAGDALYMSMGFDPEQLDPANGLAVQDAYTTAAQQVQQDAATTVYVNVQGFLAMVDTYVDQQKAMAEEWNEPADPFSEMWETLRDASGLSGVHRLMMTAGIQDKNWQTQMFLDAPAPRTGILTLIDNEPIEDVQLLHVPKTATFLQAVTIDPARIIEVSRDLMSAVDPGMAEDFDQAIAEANEAIDMNIETDLINAIGPYWTLYIDPMIAGNGFASMVMVNELRDADKVERALAHLVSKANEAAAAEFENEPVGVKIHTIEMGDAEVHYLGIPFIAPSYMIHDGKLYFALFPQALEMALEQSGDMDDSILANPAFASTMQRLGETPRTALSFSDLPKTAPEGYGMNLLLVQAFAGMSEMVNGEPSSLRLPPVGKIMPFVEPAGSVTWVDDLGLHLTSIEPFPCSVLLGPIKGAESTVLISGPLMVGIMLPALGEARGAAREAQDINQGRQLGVAAIAWAIDNKGQMPQDIAVLIEYTGTEEVFFSPRSQRAQPMPENFGEWDDARQQRFVRENSSFILLPLGNLDAIERPSETILLIQRPDDVPAGHPLIVVMADGSCQSMPSFIAEGLVQEQTHAPIAELIERQENFEE